RREGRGRYWQLAMRLPHPIKCPGRARRPAWAAAKPITSQDLRAFTLVELMVVITIIAVITAVMALEMTGTHEDALLRSNARKLIDVCDAASNRAIAVRQAQVLKIDAKSGKFFVQSKSKGEGDDEVIQGELDSRIALMIREPERDDEAEESERPTQMGAITFNPDGSADACEFLFRDRAGVELV